MFVPSIFVYDVCVIANIDFVCTGFHNVYAISVLSQSSLYVNQHSCRLSTCGSFVYGLIAISQYFLIIFYSEFYSKIKWNFIFFFSQNLNTILLIIFRFYQLPLCMLIVRHKKYIIFSNE